MKNRPNLVLAVVAAVAIVLAVVAWVFSASQSSVDADPPPPREPCRSTSRHSPKTTTTVVSLLDPEAGV